MQGTCRWRGVMGHGGSIPPAPQPIEMRKMYSVSGWLTAAFECEHSRFKPERVRSQMCFPMVSKRETHNLLPTLRYGAFVVVMKFPLGTILSHLFPEHLF
jgi:hypothetical protein